ncbi:hydroxyisourate hydrolase [Marinomonas piezotolerans]|uniref:5-hydroxyisourate hydrolase n=1 Tax=Marinomonas piezotolerans TaxID=2213058 RepID=A0A370UBH9_9GAMM|nr:hydroxyisourate hydrolase [Marinomonas piezotolerans]RDL45163.1 hydroxyisourate hydrolase [Marinomonas piezotolerans]
MGNLTTHILDTTRGLAAAGVSIQLTRVHADGSRSLLHTTVSNEDGRCDAPLLSGADFIAGQYELEFAVGDYFAANGVPLSEPRFLDVVVLRFGIADEGSHYHVPLLVTPYSYSTYRGS